MRTLVHGFRRSLETAKDRCVPGQPRSQTLKQRFAEMTMAGWMLFLHGLVASAALTAATATLADEYRLGPQDQVKVSVYEWPDLSGTFSVSAVGDLAIPLIGAVPAGGRTPTEVAHAIEEALRLRMNTTQSTTATVEVATYRPFFILGDVQAPGSYPFRPDLTVLQAVSMAGGYFRPADPGFLRLERDAITSRGDLAVLGRQIDQFEARRARLEAEASDQTEIQFPDALTSRSTEPEIGRILNEERLLLAARRQDLADRIGTLQRRIGLYTEEIGSLEGQIVSVNKQATFLDQELTAIRRLVDRGLARTPQQLELERSAAQIERERREIETFVVRARANISQAEQDIVTARGENRNEVLNEVQVVRQQLDETSERLLTARQLVFESEVSSPQDVRRQADAPARITYVVSRRSADGVVADVVAQETSELLPGDVLRVERLTRPRAGGSADAAGARGTTGAENANDPLRTVLQ